MIAMIALVTLSAAHAEDVALAGTAAPGTKFETPETHLSAELGGNLTLGNTAAWGLVGGFAGSHRVKRSEITLTLAGNIGASKIDVDGNGFVDDTLIEDVYTFSAKKFEGKLRYDHYLGDKSSLYLMVGGKIDPFAGLDSRLQAEVGFRRLLADGEKLKMSLELGVGVASENYIEGVDPNAATFLAASAKYSLAYQFNENVGFTDALGLMDSLYNLSANESALDDLSISNNAALVAKLSDKFSLKVGHALTWDNTPLQLDYVNADGVADTYTFKKFDHTTTLTFVATLL